MPIYTCKNCNHRDLLNLHTLPIHEQFNYECSSCQENTPTGLEDQVRLGIETRIGTWLPPVTSLRAISMACTIYDAANAKHAYRLEMKKKTVKKLKKRGGYHQIVFQRLIHGRTWKGLLDDSVVGAVVVFENPGENPTHSIYVVFRGSVGDQNEGKAGWMSKRQKINVDWRANFDNIQEAADYGGGAYSIHGGYKSILGSYRDRMLQAIEHARRIFPSNNVVITGHSQGGGHAVLFTHWLAHQVPDIVPNMFSMPFSPPRVGDYRFAADFNSRIVNKPTVLPYDGPAQHKAMFVIRGKDPVSFSMEHAYTFKKFRKYGDLDGTTGLVRKGLASQKAEASGRIETQIYFHPSCLKILPGAVLAKGDLQVWNHKPEGIRDIIRGNF